MDDARMQRRIQVVMVTTRAAAAHLETADGQVRAAVQRGIQLLDGMTDEITQDGDAGTREQLDRAKLELAALIRDKSP